MADDLKKALHDAGLDRIDPGNLLGEFEPLDSCTTSCTSCQGTCQNCIDGNQSKTC